MNYQSVEFLAFSAITLLLYYVVGRKLQKYVLVLANVAFFYIAGPEYLPYIAGTTLVSFLGGILIGRRWKWEAAKIAAGGPDGEPMPKDEVKRIRAKAKRRAKVWLVLCLVLMIGVLAFCKYTNFAINTINDLFAGSLEKPIELFDIVLPIGISFYTFMAIGYLLDIFWKRYEYERNFFLFAAFLPYFPHVVQGPIDRYDKFREQVKDGVKFSHVNLTRGAQLALWGFFKKLVIADRIGILVDTVYGGWEEYTGLIFVFATALYSIQIYADFSGCIDIVSGISEMFGIKLAENFRNPYFSKTMPEFWRRWHMSLMEWFKDYIFYPVSTSALVKKIKKSTKKHEHPRVGELFASCFPAFVVWVITGIWHGAAWKFVAWGMFHAALIILGNLFERPLQRLTLKLKIKTETFGWRFWQMTRTFILCGVGRVFFRAPSISAAIGIFENTFEEVAIGNLLPDTIYKFGLAQNEFYVMLFGIAVLWVVDLLREKMDVRTKLQEQNFVFRWTILLIAIAAILIFGCYGPTYSASAFIYEQF